jgi:polysaccharide export outer membrane protein
MKILIAILALALLALFAPAVRADGVAANAYILGADDVLDITVDNHMDLNKTLTILPDGTISFPEVGNVKAAGKTPEELADALKTGLEKTRNMVNVIVSVKEVHSKHLRILGPVKSAGNYDFKPGWRLEDLIAMAGGLTAKTVRVTGRLVRVGMNKTIPLNLVEADLHPDGPANIALQPDDLIVLDEEDFVRQVHVMGQVAKPGAFDLTEHLSVISLLAEAGSYTDKAWLGKAYIQRGDKQIPINLVPSVLESKNDDEVNNFVLQPGDVLVIPEAEDRYAVLGQVFKPGYFNMSEKEPTTMLQALSEAGGQTSDGDLSHASILRTVNGKTTAVSVNIDEILKKGNLAKNVSLNKGDILYIPNRSRKTPLGIQDILSPISQILTFGILRP